MVVDDGSTDETRGAIERHIQQQNQPRIPIRYIHQRQQGAPVARNTGIDAATGDWIAFLDSDDCWLQQKLELQVRALERFADVSAACVTDALYVNNSTLKKTAFQEAGMRCDEKMGILTDLAQRFAYGRHGVYLQTLVVRREILRDLGGLDPLLPLGDDTDLLFRLACRGSVCCVNTPLVEIDRHPGRTDGLIELARKEKRTLEMNQYLYEKWLKKSGELNADLRARILRRLQEVHYGWSSWYLIDRDYQRALQSLSLAMRYSPTEKVASKWLLTKIAPGLARRIILRRREKTPQPTLI